MDLLEPTTGRAAAIDLVSDYASWLASQPLAGNTRRAYLGQVRAFLEFLKAAPPGAELESPHGRLYALRDYRLHLLRVRRVKPATVNQALSALDNFFLYLGGERPQVSREELPAAAPRALEPEEVKRFLRAVERRPSLRDRALALLFFHTGLRLAEGRMLDLGDVQVSARKGRVVVRAGKGGSYREVPLNAPARKALQDWVEQRPRPDPDHPAFFLNQTGLRLSARSIDRVVRQLGREARLEQPLSAHILRHTCLSMLVRQGNDLVLVAEIAGHRRLDTTRRYSLPSTADRERAMEGLEVEF